MHVLVCFCGCLSDDTAMARIISSKGPKMTHCDLMDDPHHDLAEDFCCDSIMNKASKGDVWESR